MRGVLKQRIEAARGGEADVVIKNVNVVNLFSWSTERANVAIKSGYIVGVGTSYTRGKSVYDFAGKYLIPGLVDAHIHLESSFLSPANFARAVVPHGTTACVLDPHEIANVAGMEGIRWLVDRTEGLPLDFFFTAPSCVPATHLETSGAELGSDEVDEILKLDRCVGLGEMMNFPGVIQGDDRVLEKIERTLALGKRVDGHAPGVSGKELNAYVSTNIETDHECTAMSEVLEKLARGMKIMIREGSLAKNLDDLYPAVKRENHRRFMLVSDDVNPEQLIEEGHIDRILSKAVSLGMDSIVALNLTTLNVYEHYGLRFRGSTAPGYVADLAVLDDLKRFRVEAVFKRGVPVWLDGKLCVELGGDDTRELRHTVRPRLPVDFSIRTEGEYANVIGVIPGQLITKKLVRKVASKNGKVVADPEDDLVKLAVIERHRATANCGLGLVNGLGLRSGAMGSSVAHDSHNLVIAGTNDEDMQCVLRRLVELQGGLVAARDGKILAELPLPIAGLLSDLPPAEVVTRMHSLHGAAKELGTKVKDPFTALSFLSLPVIPELKLTDRGLVDVLRFTFISLWETD
ncbi:hypothetical protein AMJ40_00540 [candidate division TA06 bacterium DG_26]|uniref:Adenine deaminase n=1 Tax=candidate division TA06 bacterium DG_26 TaxID=1703771 RepID=A0A0S7WNN1_UNCT6|nr:MAG: hypothetical protein AMJ40_00540 [candidate division TA06 bacterium DG_26]